MQRSPNPTHISLLSTHQYFVLSFSQMASLKVVCALVICMMMSAQMGYALDCTEVQNDLKPCETYLFGGVSQPPETCCNGVTSLNNAAYTTALRQKACYCVMSFAQQFASKINVNNARSLPTKCQVKLPFTISTSTNCSRFASFLLSNLSLI